MPSKSRAAPGQHGRDISAQSARHGERGFTLGELTTTLAIAGAASALAVPALGNLYMNVRVKSLAAEFAADLRYARSEAISRRKPVDVSGALDKSWTHGWLVRDSKTVLLDRTGTTRVQTLAPEEGKLTYTSVGSLSRPGSYSVLFYAPDYRWVQPRCVYVRPDGRPLVEIQALGGACGRR